MLGLIGLLILLPTILVAESTALKRTAVKETTTQEKAVPQNLDVLTAPPELHQDSSLSRSAQNSPLGSCEDLLKECVTLSTDLRAICFMNASREERCAERTELSQVAFLRSALAPEQGGEEFSILGPQFVDAECISRFDNQLSGILIRGSLSSETARGLYRQLEQCKVTAVDEMLGAS
jgi:hypothetical protein